MAKIALTRDHLDPHQNDQRQLGRGGDHAETGGNTHVPLHVDSTLNNSQGSSRSVCI
jgi:hypothetical protein